MFTITSIALTFLQLGVRPGDVPRIIDAALDAAIPLTAHVDGSAGAPAKVIGQHLLIFDANRTYRAFQQLVPDIQSTDVRNRRPYVALDHSAAVVCLQKDVNGRKSGASCVVRNDGIYFAISSIQPGSKNGEYRVLALVEWTSGANTSGTQTEMFVERVDGSWVVTRKGTVRAYQS